MFTMTSSDMKAKIQLERLRESLLTRDVNLIERALEGCTASGVADYHPEMQRGQRRLRALIMRNGERGWSITLRGTSTN